MNRAVKSGLKHSIENSGILLLSGLGPLGDGRSSIGWLYRLVNKLISTDS